MTEAIPDDVGKLLEAELPGLLAYVRLHAGRELLLMESSSDLVHSVCRELLEKQPEFEFRGMPAFRAWLYKAALNKIRARGRRLRAEKRSPDREEPVDEIDLRQLVPSFTTPSAIAIAHEDMQQLERAFAELPEDYRRVVTEAKIFGKPHREIAVEMERSEEAVRALLYRALFRLGSLFGD